MMWCLSVKPKADSCLVGTQQGLQEKQSREEKLYVAVCVGVCEAGSMCGPADNASIHPAAWFSPYEAPTCPREI